MFQNHIRFWFELVNKKTFEMKFYKWPTSHILSSSIWKWLFIKILIFHIIMVITLKQNPIMICIYQTFHMTRKFIPIIWNHSEQISTKLKKHFNHFLNISAFFNTLWHILFWHKYDLMSYDMKYKKIVFLDLTSLGFDLP